MPIYEFACPKCRKIFSFLSKRVNPDRLPTCPKCGNRKMTRQMSAFAAPRGATESAPDSAASDTGMPDFNDAKVMRTMNEIERDMQHLDESNPKHMAHLMQKMKETMPPGSMPKEMDTAIKRLAAGEDPDKIEADMGDLLGDLAGGKGGAVGGYTHDSGLHDY